MSKISVRLLFVGLCVVLVAETVITVKSPFQADLLFGGVILSVGAYQAAKKYFSLADSNRTQFVLAVTIYATILTVAVGAKVLVIGFDRMATARLTALNGLDVMLGILLWLVPPFDNHYHFVPPSERPRPRA